MRSMADLYAFIYKGGWAMVPIIAFSVIALGMMIEKTWTFARVKGGNAVAERVLALAREGRRKEARTLAESVDQPVARVLTAGLSAGGGSGASREVVHDALAGAARAEGTELERYMTPIASLIAAETMIGFLGTITGLIQAFSAWEAAGANVTIAVLAGGMYQAMITTAAGLFVAIPYGIYYNQLSRTLELRASEIERHADKLLEALTGPAHASAGGAAQARPVALAAEGGAPAGEGAGA